MIKVFKAKNIREIGSFKTENIYYGIMCVSGKKVRMFDCNMKEVVMILPRHSCCFTWVETNEKYFEEYFEELESISKKNKRVAMQFIKEATTFNI